MSDWNLKPARDLEMSSMQRYRSVVREGGFLESIFRAEWSSFVRCSLAVCHRIKHHGRDHLPQKPSFILARTPTFVLFLVGLCLPSVAEHRRFHAQVVFGVVRVGCLTTRAKVCRVVYSAATRVISKAADLVASGRVDQARMTVCKFASTEPFSASTAPPSREMPAFPEETEVGSSPFAPL
jgi:hypothetical protein